MADDKEHYFHAEARALQGRLNLPFEQEIKQQAFVKLEGKLAELTEEKRRQRNYFSQHAKNFRLEGIVSYSAAHTQVSGHESKKHPGASVTLATSEVEDLNVLNVVTADRVVAQISTTHFPGVQAPAVTFLGTHFENLRIARHRAEPFLNLGVCGEMPCPITGDAEQEKKKDRMYVERGTGLMTAVEAQYKNLKAKLAGLGSGKIQGQLAEKYPEFPDLNYAAIKDKAQKAHQEAQSGPGNWDGVACSLVEYVEIKDISVEGPDGKVVKIPPPAKSAGHVIHIPDFGTIFLAELSVSHNSFHLTMIRLELGCLADGSLGAGTCVVNGKGGKGGTG